MQMLKFISSLVFIVQPMLRLLICPIAVIVQGVRPTSALMRTCYVLLGLVLLFGALGAERDGQQGYAMALASAGVILLILRKRPRHVAMRGTVKWYNELKGFGFIEPDDGQQEKLGHDEPLLVQANDIVDFAPWFREGASVAFKTRCGGAIATRCLQVTRIQDELKQEPKQSTIQNSGSQMPSDLLRAGWTRKAVAINGQGEPTMSDDPAAVAWSLCGAMNAVYEPDSAAWRDYLHAVQTQVGHNVGRWNGKSCRTQDEVVAVALEAERTITGDKP